MLQQLLEGITQERERERLAESCDLLKGCQAVAKTTTLRQFQGPHLQVVLPTAPLFCQSPGARRRGREILVSSAVFGIRKNTDAVVKPALQFTSQDIKRIKKDGPVVDDLVITALQKWTDKDEKQVYEDAVYAWVPPTVLGSGTAQAEPTWQHLPHMSYVELLNGLQRRNWTSKLYDQSAGAWKLAFFQNNGRRFGTQWNGYRAVVTKEDGSQAWVSLPKAGKSTFTGDHMASGTKGGIWRAKRLPKTPDSLDECGYNQVFEEVFQAYQQRLPPEAEQQWDEEGWVEQAGTRYDCPGERLLDVSFHSLPTVANVPVWLATNLPRAGVLVAAIFFLFVCLWLAIFRPRKAMPSDAFMAIEFAQSKGQARQEGKTGVKFEDVAGMDQTLRELRDIVEFLKSPARYLALGTKPPKGVLLEGEPGTGKTLVAKAIAGEAGVPFYQMSGSEFVEAIVGVGAARVRDLFKRARVQEGPCIIFVDEIDAMGARRADASEETNEEREQTLNQLLTEMDGFTPDLGVVFIGATNRTDLLDPALMRAGRFDKKFYISRPDTQGRYDVLKVHTRKRPTADDVDLMQIARDLPGLSGAELANVVNEGALECARRDGTVITSLDLYNGIDRILQGVKRPGIPERMKMRRNLAFHETGKALVATILRQGYLEAGKKPHLEAVERVTIVPRGRRAAWKKDWTRTIFLRGEDEDYTMATRARLLQRLQVVVAGRAAEEVVLPGGPTTYGRASLAEAMTLAQKVVASYGLTEVGITMYASPGVASAGVRSNYEVSVDKIDEDMFGRGLDGGMYQASDRTIGKIKKSSQGLVRDAYVKDLNLLWRYRTALEVAAERILVENTLMGSELEKIIHANPPHPVTDEFHRVPVEQHPIQLQDRLAYSRT